MIKWINKNQGLFIALIVNVCLLVWAFGCESKVQSLTSDKKLTRDDYRIEFNSELHRLELELEKLQAQGQIGFASLDRQDALKQKIFNAVAVATQTGTINPAGLVTLLGTVSAIGLGVDNRIKDKVIKNRPLPNKNTSQST